MRSKHIVVSAVIPAKNEAGGLLRIITSLRAYADEIIVVDGHSSDNTVDICKKAHVRYVLDNGKGRGDAVKLGIRESSGQYIVFFDADGSHDENDIPSLLAPLKAGKADLVICSRRTGGSSDMELNLDGLIRSFGADLLTILVNGRFKTRLTDIIYSFRAATRESLSSIQFRADDFCIEQEMVVNFLKANKKIAEIPSRERARGWGISKLRTITGITLFWQLLLDLYIRKQ